MNNIQLYQWLLVIISSLILIWVSPLAKSKQDFYHGSRDSKQPNFWLLTSSLVISWLFAKSITNAANLGLEFGIVGGIAYAGYYLSFGVAGFVIYSLRTKGGFTSIHNFLSTKFGRGAVIIFSILIAFRLFNEVWSNTMVIGTYFGLEGSTPYFASIGLFTLLTLVYAVKGGMSSSIMTDVIQMVLFAIILGTILMVILPKTEGGITTYVTSGSWTFSGGVNLLLVAFIQSFSYPFHDPVMTDRGFISSESTTLKSFIAAGLIGALCIILFSFVGIFGSMNGVTGQAPVGVAKILGPAMMLFINFIMITSAASTLDSTFSSFSKLIVLDLSFFKSVTISKGRLVMVVLTIIGTLPIFFNPAILSATTISGTMVIGLAPVFIFWKMGKSPWMFYGPVLVGLFWGLALIFKLFPEQLFLTDGKYADLLTINVYGTICCIIAFFLPLGYNKLISR